MSAARSENIIEQRFNPERKISVSMLDYKNSGEMKKEKLRYRADTLSISGFNNVKFDLNVPKVNFSHRSRQKSMEDFV
jgi:hypothetical protein